MSSDPENLGPPALPLSVAIDAALGDVSKLSKSVHSVVAQRDAWALLAIARGVLLNPAAAAAIPGAAGLTIDWSGAVQMALQQLRALGIDPLTGDLLLAPTPNNEPS